MYVNKQSNHPPAVTKNIPLAVNRRLSSISSSKEIFDSAAPIYQAELSRAGYNHKLEFTEVEEPKRKRKCKIVWFNPPVLHEPEDKCWSKIPKITRQTFPKGVCLVPPHQQIKGEVKL